MNLVRKHTNKHSMPLIVRAWCCRRTSFHAGGHHSIQKKLSTITNEDIGTGPEPAYILVKATIASIDTENCCMLHVNYLLRTDSAKKITPIEDDIWHCQRCNQQVYECEYRCIF